jgi:arabinogalactan endo-1,4-beta-galactosidase
MGGRGGLTAGAGSPASSGVGGVSATGGSSAQGGAGIGGVAVGGAGLGSSGAAAGSVSAAGAGGGAVGAGSGGMAASAGAAQSGAGRGGSAGTIAGAGTGGSAGGSTGGSAGASTGGSAGASTVYRPSFILGADITITLEDEHWGATYTDAGVRKSVEQVLKDHGFNFIRINTFVDPGASGGYAASPQVMPEPFRDLAHTIELAQRVKRIGLGFLLDLHYSDTWTNPGSQPTPAAWAGLGIAALETRVHDYTREALTQLKAANAMPDMVQIGNEIVNGMLFEVGHVTSNNFTNFARLLKAGIAAVRAVDPAIQIMLHIEKCNQTETSKWWLDGVLAQGVAFDILGQSCYAPTGSHAGYQGSPTAWASTFATLANDYPNLKFVIAEYSAEQRAANDVMFNLPNRRGLGTFNWDPTRAYDTHPNVPLFSAGNAWNDYIAIPAMMGLYDQMARDYGLR